MLLAHLEGMGRRKPLLPAMELRLSGSKLFVDGVEFGHLCEGTWDCGSMSATAIPIETEAKVRFQNGGQLDVGPFPELRIADGTIYAANETLARLDEMTQHWRLKADGSLWPHVVIRRPHRFNP